VPQSKRWMHMLIDNKGKWRRKNNEISKKYKMLKRSVTIWQPCWLNNKVWHCSDANTWLGRHLSHPFPHVWLFFVFSAE
jgi:hypothetical protein